MVRVADRAAEPAPGQAPEQLVRGDVHEERRVHGGPALGERTVQGLRLGAVAGEPVEDGAALGVRRLQPLEQHADRDLVGDQLAALHVSLGRDPERAAVPGGGPEQVAGRHPGQSEVAGENVRLGALPGARGAEQDEDPHRADPARTGSAAHRMNPS